MNRMFTHMTPEEPIYRHNFNFTFNGGHTANLLHANPWSPVALPRIEEAAASKPESKRLGNATRKSRLENEGAQLVSDELEFLCEYQTLRRMPKTDFILFTVRTEISPFSNLKAAPAAAQATAAAIRRKHRGRLHNRGVGTEGQLRALLQFLDGVATAAGLEPGLAGVVAEPWERLTVDDGTGPGRDYRGEETWHDRDRAEQEARAAAMEMQEGAAEQLSKL